MTSIKTRRSIRTIVQVAIALALAVMVAAALWWGFLREHAPANARGIKVEADFGAMKNGPAPDHFDGGQPATVLVTPEGASDQLSVQQGRLTYQPTSQETAVAYVSTPDLGSSVKGMGARFVFRKGSGTRGGAITLVVSRGIDKSHVPPMVRPLSINFVVTPINWNISISRTDRDPLQVVAAGDLPQPLQEDGQTIYEARLDIDGARVTVDLPGVRRVFTEPRISEWQGSYATFELFANHGATDSLGAFQRIWATGKRD